MEPKVLKIKRYEIPAPAGSRPLTVALTGDWHVSSIVSAKQCGMLRRAFRKIAPDLIIVLGDMVDSPKALEDPSLRAQLVETLQVCTSYAPTVGVLGNHDVVDPGHKRFLEKWPKMTLEEFRKKRVLPNAVEKFREVLSEAGAQLLADEWFEFENLRIFGLYEEEKCFFANGHWGENMAERERHLAELAQDGKLAPSEGKINWLVSHVPLKDLAYSKYVSGFTVQTYGHTHGGALPLGLDDLADKLRLTGGLYGPFGKVLPRRQMRGAETLPNGSKLIINSGMILVHECTPKPLHYLNFAKAAEVTAISLCPKL